MYHQYFVVIDLDKSHMTLTIVDATKIVVFVIAMSLFKIFTWNLSIMYSRHILYTYFNIKDVTVNLWPLSQGQIFEKSENTFFVSNKPHCSEALSDYHYLWMWYAQKLFLDLDRESRSCKQSHEIHEFSNCPVRSIEGLKCLK